MRQVIVKKTNRIDKDVFSNFSLSLDKKIVIKSGLQKITIENPIVVMAGGQVNWRSQLSESMVSSGLVLSGVYFKDESIVIYVFNTNPQALEVKEEVPIIELHAYESISIRQVEQEFNKVIILNGSLSATTITVTVPNIDKDYIIVNNSGGTATISSGGSTTVSVATGSKTYLYVDADTTSVSTAFTDAVNSPGGTTNSIQYNSAGSFAGSTNFTYDGTNVAVLNNGALRLYNTAGTFYTGLKVAAGASATATFTLPSADGTNGQAIITNGSGTLSFGNAGITAGKSIALTLVFG